MKNEFMRVHETFKTLNEMARRLGDLTVEYTTHVYTFPGKYSYEADYGHENKNGELIWFINWQAWKEE